MKVGQQRLDQLELKAGRDEDAGDAGVRCEGAASDLLSAVLKGANDRGADGDDAAALADCAIDRLCRGSRDGVTFAVQVDFIEALDAERRECSEPDVKRDARHFDALGGERIKNVWREMEAGRWGSHRSAFARKHSLIAFAIGICIVAANVRRQRHMADEVQDGEEIVYWSKSQQTLAEFAAVEHFGFEFDGTATRGEGEPFANSYFLSGLHERTPGVVGARLGEQNFNLRCGCLSIANRGAMSEKTGGNDAAVVEYNEIAGLEERGKAGEAVVAQCTGGAVHHQHTALAALSGLLLRNQLRQQVDIEVGNAKHCAAFCIFVHDRACLK